jgi:outer membrane lipoprotein-sorting protein
MVIYLKKKLLPAVLILFLFFISGCGNKDAVNNANKKLSEMKSYKAGAEISITGNKGNSVYKVTQYYAEPNKLRIETIEPSFIRGKIVVCDGKKWRVYNPLISMSFEMDSLKEADQLTYLGIVQKNIFLKEDSTAKLYDKGGEKYVVIKAKMPDESIYRKTAVLYLSEKTLFPAMMEILDDKNNPVVVVKYTSFQYNPKFDDDMFAIK